MENEAVMESPEQVAEALASETVDELKDLTPEEAVIGAKLLPLLAAKANQKAEANKAKELVEVVDQLKKDNAAMMEEELRKIREANKPPDATEMTKLLSQEYLEFTVRVFERKTKAEREFVIRELPQSIELKFVKSIKKAIVPHLKLISGVEFQTGTDVASKLQQVIEIIPELMEVLADVCAMCLDPFGDGKVEDRITKEWVQANMGSDRIQKVVLAQGMANRFRDFFSLASRFIPS